MSADLVFKTVYCMETLQQVTVVKYPSGDFENYSFNAIQKRFFPVKCQDCIATQMDSDLTPRQTAWCPHNQQNILFAYNHVLKQVLQYHFIHETNSFNEILCKDCKPDEDLDEKRNVIMACSPSSKKPFLIRMNSEGRVQKMQWDADKETYVIIAASEINALTTRPAVVEKDCEFRELPSESVMKSKIDKKKIKKPARARPEPRIRNLPCEFFTFTNQPNTTNSRALQTRVLPCLVSKVIQPSAPADPKPAEQSEPTDTKNASEAEDSFEIVSAEELPKEE